MGTRDVPTQEVKAIAIDPLTPQNVYLASPDGLFRATDGGLTWEALNASLSSEPVALTLDPQHPTTLFALLMGETLLKSDDSGTTWATVGGNP